MNNENTCIVCYKQTNINNFKLDCKCKICLDCIYMRIVILNIENLLCIDLKAFCPNHDCSKPINSDWIYTNFNTDQLNVINNIMFKKYLNTADDIIKCPNKLCAYSGYFDPKIKCSKRFICEVCNYKWLDTSNLSVSNKIIYYTYFTRHNFIPFILSEYELTKKLFSNNFIALDGFTKYEQPCKYCNNYNFNNGYDMYTYCITCKEYNCFYCFERRGLINNNYLHNSYLGCKFLKQFSINIFWLIASAIMILKIFFSFSFIYKLIAFSIYLGGYFFFCFCYYNIIFTPVLFSELLTELIDSRNNIKSIKLIIMYIFLVCFGYSVIICFHINLFYSVHLIHVYTLAIFYSIEFVIYAMIIFGIAIIHNFIYENIIAYSSRINKFTCYFFHSLNFMVIFPEFYYFIFKYMIYYRISFDLSDAFNLEEVYFFSGLIKFNRFIGTVSVNIIMYMYTIVFSIVFFLFICLIISNYKKIKQFYYYDKYIFYLIILVIFTISSILFIFTDFYKRFTYMIIENILLDAYLLSWFLLIKNFQTRNKIFKISLTILIVLEYCNYGIASLIRS